MYLGPNDFRLIKDIEEESRFGKDLDLEQLVYLGWPLFRIINRWFTIYVFDWLTSWGFSMGVVLILITLLLKAITFPMVKKSYMSSAKMRVLKPKLDEATKQYDKPEDQMQKQQAMMQLYSQYGVSPLSGCLPMLIQMPIWIAMFNFVPNAIQLRRESFLWIDDLSTYDPIIEWGTNIWGIGDHLSLTCLLFCGANILYSFMTMRQQRDQIGDGHQPIEQVGQVPDNRQLYHGSGKDGSHVEQTVDVQVVLAAQVLHGTLAVVAPAEDGGEGESDNAEGEQRSTDDGNLLEGHLGQGTAVAVVDVGIGNDTGDED
jgi:YidC/Oxa1 family membrane protein insertase